MAGDGSQLGVAIREEPMASLDEHARIPIAFEVRSILRVEIRDHGLSGFALVEQAVAEPWIKDYDADDRPTSWAKRFDLRNWRLVSAWDGATRVGGAVIAFDTPTINMLGRRADLAVLWDIRIAPEWRGRGVGSRLFRAVEEWAHARGCIRVDVETQNINVPACRFYARMGCELRCVDRLGYADLPDEVQLVWTKRLV